MRTKLVVFSSVVVTILATAGVLRARRSRPAPAYDTRTSQPSELDDLRAELRALGRSWGVVMAEQQRIASQVRDTAARPEVPVPSARDSTAMDDDDQAETDPVTAVTARLEELGRVFQSEPTDAAWRGTAVAHLTTVLSQPSLRGSRMLAVDCRTNMCRLAVSHEETGARDTFVESLPSLLGWQSDGLVQRIDGPDGRPQTVAFLSRDGRPLPANSP